MPVHIDEIEVQVEPETTEQGQSRVYPATGEGEQHWQEWLEITKERRERLSID